MRAGLLLLLVLLLPTAAAALPTVGAGPAAPQRPSDLPRVEAAGGEAAGSATPESYSANVEPSTVRLGESFLYEVVITDDAEVRYRLPRPLRLGTLAVRDAKLERREEGARAVTSVRLELAIFDALGEVVLPDLELAALRADSVERLLVPGVPLTVESTAEGEELDGLRQQQLLRVFDPLPLYVAGGLLLVGIVGFAAVRALRRRLPVEAVPEGQRGTPEERALAALDALDPAGVGDGRAFYFALSEIVRAFLEEVSALNAREMTTSELVEALVAREVPGLSLAQLGAWLERGDLHRFARVPAGEEEARADREKAREIVRGVARALRPAEAAPEGEAA